MNCPKSTELFYNWAKSTLAKSNTDLESFETAKTEHTKVPLKKSKNSFLRLKRGVMD
jgi:hypothetical protein